MIPSIFYLLDLRVFFCFLFRCFILFLPPDDGNLFMGAASPEVDEGNGGEDGVEGAATATATGIACEPGAVDAFENGLRDFSFSMVPDSDGSSTVGMDDIIDDV